MNEIPKNDVAKEYSELKQKLQEQIEENERLRRKIFGLETTIKNYKKKENALYNDLGWSK